MTAVRWLVAAVLLVVSLGGCGTDEDGAPGSVEPRSTPQIVDSVTPDILPPSIRVRTDGRSSAQELADLVQERPGVREVVGPWSRPEDLMVPGFGVEPADRSHCAGFPHS